MRKIFYLLLLVSGCLSGQDPLVSAHRGGADMAPENTLAAFKKAIEVKADFFELDVMMSSDDSLVVIHDKKLNRTSNGSGPVSGKTYAELRQLDAGSWFSEDYAGEKIPTLRESLVLAKNSPNNIGVIIEMKSSEAELPDAVVELVHKLGMSERVVFSGFNMDLVTRAKEIDPDLKVQLFGWIRKSHIEEVAAIDGEWVGSGGRLSKSLIEYSHEQGILFNAWTLNSEDKMLKAIEAGVDAITTDDPELLIALLKK